VRQFSAIASTLFMSACATTNGGLRMIESTPVGALVTIEGYGNCETPCTVKLDRDYEIIVAKAGYVTQRFIAGPDGPRIRVTLELAADTDDVETQSLPDL